MDAIVGRGWCTPGHHTLPHRSREEFLWAGLGDPTPEERQTAADKIYEQETKDNANWFVTGKFLYAVEHAEFTGLAKDILELHLGEKDWGDTERLVCKECLGYSEEYVEWPCPSARAALTSVGIEIPEEIIYDKPKPVLQDHDNPHWPFPAGPVDPFTFPLVSTARGGIRFDGGRKS